MNRKLLVIFAAMAAALTIMGFWLVSPKTVTGEINPHSSGLGVQSGEVTVVSAAPKGLIEDVDEFYSVVVIFNQPMVALQALPEGDGTGPLTISPAVKGKYRWQGTNTLVFTPSERLPMASRFSVTIPAGLKSVSGATLTRPYQWTFETQRPKLIKSSVDDKAYGISVTPVMYFLFNQTVSLPDLRNRIKMTENATGRPVSLTVTLADSNDVKDYLAKYYDYYFYEYSTGDKKDRYQNQIYKVRPVSPLTRSTGYTMEIMSGLKGLEGDLGTLDPTRVTFTTHDLLSVAAFNEPLYPGSYLSFEFSTRVEADELQKKISISPAAEIRYIYNSYWDNPNTVKILYDLKAQTKYTIRIDKSLTDEFDQKLGSVYQREFRTGDYEPAVTFLSGAHVVESNLGHFFYAYALNPLNVGLKMANLDQSALIKLINSDWTWSESLDFMSWDFTWNGVPKTTANQIQRVPIDLNRALKQNKSGVVLVEMKHYPWMYPQRALIQVTDMSVTAKFSRLNNLIHVTSLKDALPVAGAFIEIRDNQGLVKWQGQTDAGGFAKTPGWESLGIRPTSDYEEPMQWVFVKKGDQIAYAYSGETISLWRFNVNYSWSSRQTDEVVCHLFTNQGIYRPGDKVHIKGITRTLTNDQWTLNTKQAIQLEIKNPDYETVLTKQLTPNRFGGITLDYTVTDDSPLGYFTISATAGGVNIGSRCRNSSRWKPK